MSPLRSYPGPAVRAGVLFAVGVCGFFWAAPAAAQAPASLSGRVYGDGGAPIVGGEVILAGHGRAARTDIAGRFEFLELHPGQYTVLVRAIGYEPNSLVVVLGDAGLEPLEIFLTSSPYRLENIVVVGERRGIHGVVLDPDRLPAEGAEVRILGGGEVARTDSSGRFSFPNRHGATYALRVVKAGYLARPVFLDVPTGQSREVTVHLEVPPSGYRSPLREEEQYQNLASRLAWTSRLGRLAGAELEKFPGMRVCDIPMVKRMVASLPPPYPIVVIDGHLVLRGSEPCEWLVEDMALIELDISCSLDGIAGANPTMRRGMSRSGIGRGCVGLWRK